MHCLVFTDTDLYSLTKGKAYLANQRWRRSTCLRDQCYDVGCHPWKGKQSFLYATHRPDIIHIPVKYHENIPNSYQLWSVQE